MPSHAQSYTSVILPESDRTVGSAPASACHGGLRVASDGDYQPTAQSRFTFSPSSLPRHATVTEAELRLVLNDAAQDAKAPQAMQLFAVAPGGSALAGSSAPGVFSAPAGAGGLAAEVAAATAPGTSLSIAALAQGYKTDACFFSSAQGAGAPSRKPRLVVRYELSNPATMSWPQPQADAQHSGRNLWTSNAFPGGVQTDLKTVFKAGGTAGGALHMNPLIFGANLYVAEESFGQSGKEYYVTGVSPDGAVIARSQAEALHGPPLHQPVVDPNGVLYYPTADGVTFFELREGITARMVPALASTELRQPPTIGVDGAAYLALASGEVVARTPYPRLEAFWSYDPGGTDKAELASVTLSPDQSLAYVSALVTSSQAVQWIQLTALDNRTGEVLATFQSPPGDFEAAPIAVAGPDGVYLVLDPCTLAHDRNACLLGFTDSQPFATGDAPAASWSPSWVVKSNRPAVGLPSIGTPAVGPDGAVYTSHDSGLRVYDGKSGKLRWSAAIKQTVASSNLVLDGDGNVVLFSGNTLYAFSDRAKKLYEMVPKSGSDINKNLVLAPDGMLYVNDGLTLFAILPDLSKPSVEAEVIVSAEQVGDAIAKVYRGGQSIKVSGGTLKGLSGMILQSGGSLSLQPGFTVEDGAWLVLQSGMQP